MSRPVTDSDLAALAARIHDSLRIDHRVFMSINAAHAAARATVAVLVDRGVIERANRCTVCGQPVDAVSNWCSPRCFSEDEHVDRDEALADLEDQRRAAVEPI